MNGLKILKGFMIFLALMVSIGGMSAAASAATLSTDKPDYAPGEVVIITGSGWLPGETVSIILHEDSQLSEPDVTLPSDADADGNIINAVWSPDINDIGLTFTLTATGLSSGLTAQTTFTDAGSCGNGNLQPNSPQNEQCDDGNTASGDGCSDTCQIETGWICNNVANGHPDSSCTPDCGDGLVVGTEQCDEGEANNGTAGSCCTSTCTFKPADTECRASAGECDMAESCTGSSGQCPADVKSTAVCRTADGDCDVAESCNGVSNNCPTDSFLSSSNVCRSAAGECDLAETCTGSSADCPVNAVQPEGTTCTDDSNVCTTDVCNGSTSDPACTHPAGNAGTMCRAAVNECDAAETCTGSSADCPVNAVQPAGTTCTDDGNVCTTDVCNGSTSAPACEHPAGNAGTVCRAAQGECDMAETCTGNSADCPTDVKKPAETACTDEGNPCTADQCDGTSDVCQHEGPVSCGAVTDSSLCPFDVDNSNNSPVEDQFRLILTPDQSASIYKLNASNPGQFYYNVFNGSYTAGAPLVIDIPYPFVTQGAVPIHVYDGAPVDANGCLLPGNEVTGCTINTIGDNLSPSGAPVILLDDYGSTTVTHFDVATTAQVTCPVPPLSGFLYVNIHLDYGLKKTTGYSNSNSNVVNAANTSQVIIPNMESYTFEFGDGNSITDSYAVQSENTFKRNPGVGGLVLHSGDDDAERNVKCQIYDSNKKLVGTAYTDQDGWYMWQYKYTGKAATFTVKLPDYNLQQSLTLKSNGFVFVPFTLQ